jgi:hypothetical protein
VKRLAFALAALLPAPALLALHFRDGPPARVTGGFGEDSCIACHSGNAANEPPGALAIEGLPATYDPGVSYPLELVLERRSARVAGFQLAVRYAASGAQAGSLQDAGPAVSMMDERGIRFAQHRAEQRPGADGIFRWRLTWTAPQDGKALILHAAAVAGDGDESQAGDYVYTLALKSAAAD